MTVVYVRFEVSDHGQRACDLRWVKSFDPAAQAWTCGLKAGHAGDHVADDGETFPQVEDAATLDRAAPAPSQH